MYKNQPDVGLDQRGIVDGQEFSVEGARVRALHSPGHTTDHMAFVLLAGEGGKSGEGGQRARRDGMAVGLFTGDNVLGHGTAVFEDLPTYLASLGRMSDAVGASNSPSSSSSSSSIIATSPHPPAPVLGFPGHGDVIDDVRARIAEYIEHRAQREREIIQALRLGPSFPLSPSPSTTALSSPPPPPPPPPASSSRPNQQDSLDRGMTETMIVQRIYRNVRSDLHWAARMGVVQVLEKLRREGRVVVVVEEEGATGAGAGTDHGGGERYWRLTERGKM